MRSFLAACVLCVAVGLAGELAWRWCAIELLGVTPTLATLQDRALLLDAVVPVVGNAIGYRLARSATMFVVPGILLAGVGVAVSLAQLPPSAGASAVAATVVLVLITPAVVLTVLSSRPIATVCR